MLFQPNKNDQNTDSKPHSHHTKCPPTTTKVPYTTHCHLPIPHTHAWVRVKPVCEAVYTASLCLTTITHHTPTRHKPRNHAVSHVSHAITIHHITHIRTPHKHPHVYTHKYRPHVYSPKYTTRVHHTKHARISPTYAPI